MGIALATTITVQSFETAETLTAHNRATAKTQRRVVRDRVTFGTDILDALFKQRIQSSRQTHQLVDSRMVQTDG